MPAFEWVHVQLHQQKGMISLSPPTICNSALIFAKASKHVAALKNSLDYYYGSSVIPPQNHGGYL
ncbi:hypothetical protein HF527_03500 [Escherichia coli]|nr:hypothetical protein HF527_03500 [Escherichia coli]QMV82710.1 hypothetical protein [Escherichia coli]